MAFPAIPVVVTAAVMGGLALSRKKKVAAPPLPLPGPLPDDGGGGGGKKRVVPFPPGAPVVTIAVTTGEPGMNVRAATSRNSALLSGVFNGERVAILEDDLLETGLTASAPNRWAQVQTVDGIRGFIRVIGPAGESNIGRASAPAPAEDKDLSAPELSRLEAQDALEDRGVPADGEDDGYSLAKLVEYAKQAGPQIAGIPYFDSMGRGGGGGGRGGGGGHGGGRPGGGHGGGHWGGGRPGGGHWGGRPWGGRSSLGWGWGGGWDFPYWAAGYEFATTPVLTQAYNAWKQAEAAGASPVVIAQLKARFETLLFGVSRWT